MALSTSTNSSIAGQANAQNPQTATGPSGPVAAPGKNVQPGTADSLLKGPGGGSVGIPLNSTILPVTNLDTSTQTTAEAAKPTDNQSQQHHPNTLLLAVVAVLVVLAMVAFVTTNRSAKNTTHH